MSAYILSCRDGVAVTPNFNLTEHSANKLPRHHGWNMATFSLVHVPVLGAAVTSSSACY